MMKGIPSLSNIGIINNRGIQTAVNTRGRRGDKHLAWITRSVGQIVNDRVLIVM
jgi:hypothetical protein